MVQRKNAVSLMAVNSAVWVFVVHQFVLSAAA
jgi:hypothetical protein